MGPSGLCSHVAGGGLLHLVLVRTVDELLLLETRRRPQLLQWVGGDGHSEKIHEGIGSVLFESAKTGGGRFSNSLEKVGTSEFPLGLFLLLSGTLVPNGLFPKFFQWEIGQALRLRKKRVLEAGRDGGDPDPDEVPGGHFHFVQLPVIFGIVAEEVELLGGWISPVKLFRFLPSRESRFFEGVHRIQALVPASGFDEDVLGPHPEQGVDEPVELAGAGSGDGLFPEVVCR